MNTGQNFLKLSSPTVFSDLNKRTGKESAFITTELKLDVIKYKHLKQLPNIHPTEHMGHMIQWMTGLAESDLDELSAEDVAELIKIIHGSMKKYHELAKDILEDAGKEQLLGTNIVN